MNGSGTKGEQGFTLIEILAAFTILIVVAVPLTHIFLQGNQLAWKAERRTVALYIAQQKMEELIAQGYVIEENTGTFIEEDGYWGTVSLFPNLNLILVTVEVNYSSLGSEYVVQLSSLLPEGE